MSDTPLRMNADQYVSERFNQYQDWYDKKAVKMKSNYLRMRVLSVIGGALVPALINIPYHPRLVGVPVIQAVVTVISLSVVISVSLETVYHYREQWKNYRSTEQLIVHEKYLFQTRVGRYRDLSQDDAFRVFVERIEDAVAAENAATLNTMTTASETLASWSSPTARTESPSSEYPFRHDSLQKPGAERTGEKPTDESD